MDEFNTLTGVQEQVVDAQAQEQDTQIDTDYQGTTQCEDGQEKTDIDTKPVQSSQDNKAAKAARIQAQQESQEQILRLRQERDDFAKSIGFETYETMVEEVERQNLENEALQKGISPEEIIRSREQEEELERFKAENEALKSKIFEVQFQDELQKIKQAFPTESANSVDDLGEDFIKLRANGIDPLIAYRAVKEQEKMQVKPTPPPLGAVNEVTTKEKDFYTPDEVDKLTDKDLSNPRIMKKVQHSMTQWKK